MQKAKGVPCMMIWTIPEYFQKLNLVHVSSVGVNGNPPIYWKNVSTNEAGFSGEHILMTTGSISKACFVSSRYIFTYWVPCQNGLMYYTEAKKDWHPYYINTIEMRSLWTEIKYIQSPDKLLDRD